MSSASVLQSRLILSPTCVQSLAPLAGARHPMVSALLPQCLHCSLHKTVTPEAGTTLVLMFHCFTALVTHYSMCLNPIWSCQKLFPMLDSLGQCPRCSTFTFVSAAWPRSPGATRRAKQPGTSINRTLMRWPWPSHELGGCPSTKAW